MIDIAGELRKIRESSGLSQQKMADLIGIPQRTWSSYENGQTRPKMDVLLALAAKGHTIKGVTSSLMEDWTENQKKEYRRRMEILKTGAFPPEMPMDDFVKIVKAVDDNPPFERDNLGLISELEKTIHKAIDNSKKVTSLESRLSALEGKYDNLPENKAAPELKIAYPSESGDGEGYTADPEPRYNETVDYFDDIAAGPPIWQVEDFSRVVDVPGHLIKTKPEDYYAMHVKGNSMIDAFIPDGSLVLIHRSDVPKHGKIQVLWIDDRVTLKRMREGKDRSWELCYEDGTGRAIPLGEKNLVQGDFVAVLPPFTKPRMRGRLCQNTK
jgi:SOS-response transcriptional repressor LexA/DNA-binding XRE family transcriptional regulator